MRRPPLPTVLAVVVLAGALLPVPSDAETAVRRDGPPTVQPRDPAPPSPGRYRGQGQYRGATPVERPESPWSALLPPYAPGSVSVPFRYEDLERRPRSHDHGVPLVYVPVDYGTPFGYDAPPQPAQPVVIVVQAPAPAPAPPPPPPPPYVPPPPEPRPAGADEPGEVWLKIAPADALVVLDDRVLGTAAEAIDPTLPIELDAGVYVLEVSHPDHPSARVMFAANATAATRVEVDLAADRPGRRTRVSSVAVRGRRTGD